MEGGEEEEGDATPLDALVLGVYNWEVLSTPKPKSEARNPGPETRKTSCSYQHGMHRTRDGEVMLTLQLDALARVFSVTRLRAKSLTGFNGTLH